jgi:hypothetical protein
MSRGFVPPASATNGLARIDLSGAFFSADVQKIVERNTENLLRSIAQAGEDAVEARSPRGKTGAFAEGILGRVENLDGKPWHGHMVISATHIYPWHRHVGATISRRESGGRRLHRRGENRQQAEYRGGKLEARYHMFRSVASQMRSGIREVMTADLTKGLE